MAIGDIYYVKWKIENTGLGTVYTPGIHVRQDGVSFDANGTAERVRNLWLDPNPVALRDFYTASTRLTAILIRRVDPLEPIEQAFTTGLPSSGTALGDETDPATSILVSWRTALIGRSYRGRTYFPAPAETFEDNGGAMSALVAGQIADQAETMRVALGAAGHLTPMVIYSKKPGVSPTAVSHLFVDRRLRNQRRRQVENPLYVSP